MARVGEVERLRLEKALAKLLLLAGLLCLWICQQTTWPGSRANRGSSWPKQGTFCSRPMVPATRHLPGDGDKHLEARLLIAQLLPRAGTRRKALGFPARTASAQAAKRMAAWCAPSNSSLMSLKEAGQTHRSASLVGNHGQTPSRSLSCPMAHPTGATRQVQSGLCRADYGGVALCSTCA